MKFKFSFEVYELITVLLSAKLFTDLILILSSEIYCTVCVLVSIILVAFSSLYVPFPKLLLVLMKITFLQKPESGDPSESKDVQDNEGEEENTEEDNGQFRC